jgi:hypothetical protein
MKIFCRGLVLSLILLAILVAIPAAAQDIELTETYTFEDGTSFQYPDAWTLDAKSSYVMLQGDHTQVFMVEAASFEDDGFTENASLQDALEAYFKSVFVGQIDFDADKAKEVEIGGREAMRYDYDDPSGDEALLIVIRFSDDTLGALDSVSLGGRLTEEDEVLAIAASLDRGESGGASGDVSATTDTTPCTASTGTADSVPVRVGPGTNRAPFVFLPVDQDFTVLGKAEASDGSLWWKLDKQEVAPKKSAAEAWVAQLDVEESGGCDAVVDVNAPPVIPIVAAPPTTGGGNSGGGGGGSNGQPAGAGESIPQAGSWTFSYPKTMPGSCTDIPTQNIQIDIPSETVSISSVSGSSLLLDGSRFNHVAPNTYQGSWINVFGDPVLFTLRVASPTLMGGEFIISFTQDNHQCSVTVNSTMTHN